MRLTIGETLRYAASPVELLVVVDVFRACAVACAALSAGAEVRLVRDADQAFSLRENHPDWLLAGERDGLPVSGFDFPNSPSFILDANLAGRTLVLTSDACVPAVLDSEKADRVLLGSFINASAVVDTLQKSQASAALLLAPGDRGRMRSLEDTMCSMFLKNAVEDYPNSYEVLRNHLRGQPSADIFFDPARPDASERDFELCMELDRYGFVVEAVEREPDACRLIRLEDAASAAQGGVI